MSEYKPVVLVTGASKGIGKGIASVFANSGYRVVLLARNTADLIPVVEKWTESGMDVMSVSADITDMESMKAAVKAIEENYQGLDVVCANAGIFPAASLEEMSVEDWDFVMSTNLKGTFITVQSTLPLLKKSSCGRVIVTSSITGPVTGYPGWSHYGASKAGQLGFIRTASIELAKYQITMNAIMPGNILTEGLAELGEDYLDSMSASIPLKRLGHVEDIGYAAKFLASKEAGYITGQTLVVDGGQILPESLDAVN